ncbi:MAG: GGDEF domain-containing protein [Betaproteobacteria bacterium]|nr:GGDEF domain-containing protein [Betaproteobacteria bacterium]MDH3436025.1 GGDEF domain-containing protein [Betaproteobacteria bacterium]
MIEIELAEIEDRIPTYPSQAQADIRWLTKELRKLRNDDSRHPEPPASAIYDPLTGLLSGGAYGVRFAMARARAGRNKKIFAVMSVYLPLAKSVAAGALSKQDAEETLKQVAMRLTDCVRKTDTVARVDHEKFAVILEDLVLPENAERVKQKVQAALAEPVKLGERATCAELSINLQFFPTSRPAESSVH